MILPSRSSLLIKMSLISSAFLVGAARSVVGHCTPLHPPSYRPPLDLSDRQFLKSSSLQLTEIRTERPRNIVTKLYCLCQLALYNFRAIMYNFKPRFLFLPAVYALSVCVNLCSICTMCAIYPITHCISYICSSSPFTILCATQREE